MGPIMHALNVWFSGYVWGFPVDWKY